MFPEWFAKFDRLKYQSPGRRFGHLAVKKYRALSLTDQLNECRTAFFIQDFRKTIFYYPDT
jgi:hypothetical protein